MKYIKRYESYSNSTLNELIVKYYNDYSDEIIEIIDTYEKVSDVENILEKISFIIESRGDVKPIEKDGEVIAYFISMKNDDKHTFFFDVEKQKFLLTTYNKYKSEILNESISRNSEKDSEEKELNEKLKKILECLKKFETGDTVYDIDALFFTNTFKINKIYVNDDTVGTMVFREYIISGYWLYKGHKEYDDRKLNHNTPAPMINAIYDYFKEKYDYYFNASDIGLL